MLKKTTMKSKIKKYNYAHSTRREMADFVPTNASRVLDVGCHTGGFGEYIKSQRSIEIWGVEPDMETAVKAETFLDKVIKQPFDYDAEIPNQYFDIVIFNDVLEHLTDPWSALVLAKEKLRHNGQVIVSLPNMLHINNLLHIIRDKDFQYEPWGIRDKTHLRFFTQKSAHKMFVECGYEVTMSKGINENWWQPSLMRRLAFKLFPKLLEETKYIQFAFVANPNNGD